MKPLKFRAQTHITVEFSTYLSKENYHSHLKHKMVQNIASELLPHLEVRCDPTENICNDVYKIEFVAMSMDEYMKIIDLLPTDYQLKYKV